jgi:hydroxymethylpyrimidine/phosphomethylpyrimidine kinase
VETAGSPGAGAVALLRSPGQKTPVVLSIAGFDPSSGAGITADIKTAAAHGCYAATCITALTVQSTQGVRAVEPVDADIVSRTLHELAQDLPICGVRLGMLGSGPVAQAVAEFLEAHRLANIVVDPVVRSSSGAELLAPDGVAILRRRILPLAAVVTPNLEEAYILTGIAAADLPEARRAGELLLESGVQAVVVTGGHLPDPVDTLVWKEKGILQLRCYPSRKLESTSTHGTGCAFATSLTCCLSLGIALPEAVAQAQQYVFRAIQEAEPLGRGVGPINHLWKLEGRDF